MINSTFTTLEITKELKEHQKAEITIHLEPEDYKPQVTKRLKEQAKQANIPGFRPGKVPLSLVKKMVGMNVLLEEVSQKVSESLNNFIQEENIAILGEPLPTNQKGENDFDVNCNIPLDFTFEIGLAPKVDISYDLAELPPVYQLQVDDDFLEQQIEQLRDRFAEVEEQETVQEGDIIYGKLIELDEKGEVVDLGFEKMIPLNPMRVKKEGALTPFNGKSVDETIPVDIYSLVEESSELKGLLFLEEDELAQLAGKSLGFTIKKINRTTPAFLDTTFFHKALGLPDPTNGQVESSGSIQPQEEEGTSVEEIIEDEDKVEANEETPESTESEESTSKEQLNDGTENQGEESEKEIIEDLNAFKEKLAEKITEEYQNAGSWFFTKEVKDKLIEKHPLTLPDEFLKKWLLASNENKVTEEQIENEYDQFRESLSWSIILRELEDQQSNLRVTKEDVQNEVRDKLATMFPDMADLDSLVEYSLQDQQMMNRYESQLREDRLSAFFVEKFKPEEKAISISEFNEIIDKNKEKA